MKPTVYLAPLLLLIASCGTLRETALSIDDVYDIPDREAMAATPAPGQPAPAAPANDDDYYDAHEARSAASSRDYYDVTYNDPYYYNYGRFGFGTGLGNPGPGWGMGLSYGWPTSFGSMSLGYGSGMYGYDPYWSNSWMSGYGYNPYGYYGYGQYGYGYGGYGTGYGPYQGPWGGCYGCYEPIGYGHVVYAHRPSMSTGGSSAASAVPRMSARNPVSLLSGAPASRQTTLNAPRSSAPRESRSIRVPETPSRSNDRERSGRPSRSYEAAPSSPSRSTGGNTGGGISSPRPR
ncbi:MAG: hypothetical protein KBH07_00540 [Flavobacteriales bacterium]|nr:hypothetical protein [Flavobacteriales bacterium]MBP9079473.1 hypothetical protein [Flavobacteriales bacterium]